jgi:hypothetical protein
MGDFNTDPRAPELQSILAGFRDAWNDAVSAGRTVDRHVHCSRESGTMSMTMWIGAAVGFVGIVALVLFRSRDGKSQPDLGSVSRSWTTEHNASHGKDSSSN